MSDPPADPAPLILTLTLDPGAEAQFGALRRTYFPAGRLHVGAHVTLFHALPGGREPMIRATLMQVCLATPALEVAVTGLRFLGHGVAYALAGAELASLRAALRARFAAWLTPQDRAIWSPHLTVQNKVTPQAARATMAALAAVAVPTLLRVPGLSLWRYRGGPWERVADYRLRPPAGLPDSAR